MMDISARHKGNIAEEAPDWAGGVMEGFQRKWIEYLNWLLKKKQEENFNQRE